MDFINLLANVNPDSPLAGVRLERPAAVDNAQESFYALMQPDEPGAFSHGERFAVGSYVATVLQVRTAGTYYSELMLDVEDRELRDAVLEAAERDRSSGPYGVYRESGLTSESEPGGVAVHDPAVFGERLAAALDVAHLLTFHPRDSRPEVLGRLARGGWGLDEAVSLYQLVSFLNFQLRVIHALQVINGQPEVHEPARLEGEEARWGGEGGSFEVSRPDGIASPERFVAHPLRWVPWAEPIPENELTDTQRDALVEPSRAANPYFRLLARDPDALKARTLTDNDIFYNTEGGAGRAERELAAAVVSRYNGCTFCASVHAGRAIEESGREDEVKSLLERGVRADLSDPLWNAVRDAAVALTTSPMRFDEDTVTKFADLDVDATYVLDIVNAAAFFNWANRLMLGLGEPEVPRPYRDK